MKIIEYGKHEKLDINEIDLGDLQDTFSENKKRFVLNEKILTVMPDMKLSMRALTSMVRSPSGTRESSLVYNLEGDILPTSIKSMLIKEIKSFVNMNYKLDNDIKQIINNTLFKYGSECYIILPDIAINDFVMRTNIGLESMKQDLKLNNNELLTISDDMSSLICSQYSDVIYAGTESKTEEELVNNEIEVVIRAMNENRAPSRSDIKSIKDFVLDEDSKTGRPLVIKVEPSAIVPLVSKNDSSKHLGYFCLVDEYGNIVNNDTSGYDDPSEINDGFDKLKNLLFPGEMDKHRKTNITVEKMQDEYNNKVSDIIKRYTNSITMNEIIRSDDYDFIINIAFRRALIGARTNLLYLDRDNVVYYANEYRSDGVGKSLLEDISVILSLRALLLFASIKGAISNSNPITQANVTLDDADPEPIATMESVLELLLKSRMDSLPVGMLDPEAISNWLHRAGIMVNFKHKDLPDMEIDVSQSAGEAVIPDTGLLDMLKDFSIRSLGLPPELIENVDEINFAKSIVAMQSMMIDTIDELQSKFNVSFTKHVKLLLINDSYIRKRIEKILHEKRVKIKKYNKAYSIKFDEIEKAHGESALIKSMFNVLMENISVELPKSPSQEDDVTSEDFDRYKQKVTNAVEMFVSADIYDNEEFGDVDPDVVQNMLTSTLMRKWMIDTNYLQDLTDAISYNSKGEPRINLIENHSSMIEAMQKSLTPFLKTAVKTGSTLSKVIEEERTKIEEQLSNENNGEEIEAKLNKNGESDTKAVEDELDF